MAVLTVLGVVACAHGPRRDLEPIPGQLGCYLVRVDRGQADRDLPPWFRAHIPDQLALTAERESGDETFEPGWRLATLGGESDEAMRALKDGKWWPLQKGGIRVRLGDGFSGVKFRLRPVAERFDGQAETYQDVGDVSYPAHVTFERLRCVREPTIIDRRRGP